MVWVSTWQRRSSCGEGGELVILVPELDHPPLVGGQPGRGRGRPVPPVGRGGREGVERPGEVAPALPRGLLAPGPGGDPAPDHHARQVRQVWHVRSRDRLRAASRGRPPAGWYSGR